MIATDEETIVLDESILDDEADCQMRHNTIPCSVAATHLFTCCLGPRRICETGTKHLRTKFLPQNMCAQCGKFVVDDWELRPI